MSLNIPHIQIPVQIPEQDPNETPNATVVSICPNAPKKTWDWYTDSPSSGLKSVSRTLFSQ